MAISQAARRSLEDGAEVTAVHLLNESLLNELTKAASLSDGAIRAEWETRLRSFVDASAPANGLFHIEVRIGSPVGGILNACGYRNASHLFVGAGGSDGDEHRIGAVAAKCVREAPCHVMVVRREAADNFKTILVCVDFSPNSVAVLKQALHIAQQDGAVLHCLYVFQSPLSVGLYQGDYMFGHYDPATDEIALQSWRMKLDALVDLLALAFPGVKVNKVIENQSDVRFAIIDTIENTNAELVVLGTSGDSPIRHFLLGTTSERIIRDARCSILAVRPEPVQIA
jgi:universal stress protein E